MASIRWDDRIRHARRVVAPGMLAIVAGLVSVACTTPTSPPASNLDRAMTAGELEWLLRREAAVERRSKSDASAISIVRPVSFDGVVAPGDGRPSVRPEILDPQAELSSRARSRVDLAVAPMTATESGGSVSRDATRFYLEGRAAIAEGRPEDAIEPLRASVRRGGGAAAIRALTEAYDRAGMADQAMNTRRELARLGALSPEDRTRLVDALLRRRAIDEALAVQSVAVLQALQLSDEASAIFESIRFAELMEAAGQGAEARSTRLVIDRWLSDVEGSIARGRDADVAVLRRFLLRVGDDAARSGDVVTAFHRWEQVAEIDDTPDATLRARRLRAAFSLGMDLGLQALLLDAIDAPTADDLAFAASLGSSEPSADLGPLLTILEATAAGNHGVNGSVRLLVALDPARGGVMLERLASENRGEVAGPLVAAAFAGGATAAIEVATSIDGSIDVVDAVVDALLAGPIDSESLLTALDAWSDGRSGSSVSSEVWRRHERPDRAVAQLATADQSDPVVRIAWLRLLADVTEPTLVLDVPEVPFDATVEVARVKALLASGEPELARAKAVALLQRRPEDPAVLAIMARVESTRRGGEIDAVEFAARARRAGDGSMATMVDLAEFAARVPDGDALSIAARRVLAGLADDPRFRMVLEADAALAAGDPATAILRLEPRIADFEAREVVLMRLLAAWRAAGRLAEGRLRLQRLVAEHPADPVLADALFAIDGAIEGPRAMAIDLRPRAAGAFSGQPQRRLELVLAEIPESAREATRVSLDRLERRPPGPASDTQRLATLIDSEDVALRRSAMDAVQRIDVARLTPRLRRQLVSVAAALPDQEGRAVIERIAADIEAGDVVDVDTAVALAHGLEERAARELLNRLRPAPAWTRRDSTWRDRIAAVAGRDPAAAAVVASLALSAPRWPGEPDGLLRTAIGASVLAGWDADSVLDLMGRAAALGWDPGEAWPDGDPADLQRLAALASDATMLGRERLSVELMQRAVDASPNDPVLLNNLGYALLEAGRKEEARPLLLRSRELDPESASTLDSMGWLRFHEGRHDSADPESAVSLIRESVAIRLGDGRAPSAEVLMHLADASWAAGDRATAEDIWRRIAAPVPDADRQRRLAGIRAYQFEVWGGELVPSADIDHLLEGRWSDQAASRLEAIRDGRSPISGIEVDGAPDA